MRQLRSLDRAAAVPSGHFQIAPSISRMNLALHIVFASSQIYLQSTHSYTVYIHIIWNTAFTIYDMGD